MKHFIWYKKRATNRQISAKVVSLPRSNLCLIYQIYCNWSLKEMSFRNMGEYLRTLKIFYLNLPVGDPLSQPQQREMEGSLEEHVLVEALPRQNYVQVVLHYGSFLEIASLFFYHQYYNSLDSSLIVFRL